MTTIIDDLSSTLELAKSIPDEQLKAMYKLRDEYFIRCDGSDICPSEFNDLLASEMRWSNYTISTLVLDGECGNFLETTLEDAECESEEQEQVIEELVGQIFSWV